MACYKSGGCGVYEMYSCSECPASRPGYALRGRKNIDVIRSWPAQKLADALITQHEEAIYDYDYDDELYISGHDYVYRTSDGESFGDYDEALEHEVWWLSQEANYDD